MKTTTQCCGGTTACSTETVLRPRFFARQIITPDDLTLMQDYFRARMRWHNLMMHGWGVVCGVLVCPAPAPDGSGPLPWTVIVRRGYVIGPCGDEIILDCERTVDLRTAGVTGVTGEACVEPVDPWCTDVFTTDGAQKLYIAVRYKEMMTRPVRVQPYGCGCDDSRCEYSRWRDGYEIGVLTVCPCPPVNPRPDLKTYGQGPTPDCPCAPETQWVGLAEVDLNSDGTVTAINNCSCRRLVLSYGSFWWTCTGNGAVKINSVEPANASVPPGGQIDLTVTGTGFLDGAVPTLGSDIAVSNVQVSVPTKLSFTATPNSTAVATSRKLVVTNPDCTWTESTNNAITVGSTATPTKTLRTKKTPA
jgi:hypothetical protein